MPRLRQTVRQAPAGAVPSELFDHRAAAWQTTAAARRWCADHSLPGDAIRPVPDWWEQPAQRRRADALHRWAIANGYTSPTHPVMPDWHTLAALGLAAAGSPTARRV